MLFQKIRSSLRLKLILGSVVIEAVMLFVLLSNSVRLINDAIQDHAKIHLEEIPPLLNGTLAPLLFQRDYAAINDFLNDVAIDDGLGIIYIIIFDNSGQIHGKKGDIDIENLPKRNDMIQEKIQSEIIHSEIPLSLSNTRIGKVKFGISLSHLIESKNKLFKQGLLIAASEIILTIILLGLLGFILTKHIVELVKGANNMSRGDFNVTVPISGTDEVSKLAKSFNKMASAIQENMDHLKQNEEKFRQLAENVREVFWIGSPDWEKVYYISPAYEDVWGMSCESLYRDPLSWLQAVKQEDIGSVKAAIPKEIEGNEEVVFPEYRIVRPDGTIRWILARAYPIRNELGEIYRFAGIAEDITDRKNSDEERERYLQRQALHVEQTILGVIEWDLEFRVVQWNKAAENIFGFSDKEAIGQSGMDLITSKKNHDLVLSIWNDLVNKKGGNQSTNENVTKDGRTILCNWYNTTLVDSEDNVIGVASLVQDITENRKFRREKAILEQQLQQSQKMEAIGTLAGGIAHDFNNILGIILGYADLIKGDVYSDVSSDSRLDEIIKAGNRAKDLVSQILAFSRQDKAEFIPLQPSIIINEALKMLRSSIPTTIKIESNIPKTGLIFGDPTQLHQIIINLCTNAYHSMRETGGILKVSLESIDLNESSSTIISKTMSPGPYVKIEVSDTGKGMDKKTKQKIFEPYFTTKKRGEGTGLGLSVVHGIINSFQGHISVFSEPLKGTVFRVYLPQVKSETEVESDKPKRISPLGLEHLLVVDDEKPIVDVYKSALEKLGYKVTACTSSFEALKIYQRHYKDIALVFTDMTMPDMTGIELIRNIRSVNSDIPVILCSGFSDLINEEKIKSFKNLAYLRKPVLNREIAVTVRDMLDGK